MRGGNMDYVRGSRRANYFLARTALIVMAVAASSAPPITHRRDHQSAAGGETPRALETISASEPSDNGKRVENKHSPEELTIRRIKTPFLQGQGDWMQPGKGISMCSNGEPKSGTTWAQRIITELAIQLCGSPTNAWCKIGGLFVDPHQPAPNYVWELLHADTGELFLHFNGKSKHKMIGLDVEDCNPRGRQHRNTFDTRFPCRKETDNHTRESISKCLPDTSERCAQLMPSRDPAVLRISVVFRDPRDVVISEHRMRTKVYKWADTPELDLFIYQRFEKIVSWQFYRWMWHKTYYKDGSHVMFYEDLKSKPEALAELASFMGLNSSLEQIRNVQEIHKSQSPHGSFNTYGLPSKTIEYMNAIMSKLSPKEMLARYVFSRDSR